MIEESAQLAVVVGSDRIPVLPAESLHAGALYVACRWFPGYRRSMRIFHLARRRSRWLRVVLAGLLLAFVLDSVAHLSHTHEPEKASVAHSVGVPCGFCAMFGGLTETSWPGEPLAMTRQGAALPLLPFQSLLDRRPASSARPRAPPVY